MQLLINKGNADTYPDEWESDLHAFGYIFATMTKCTSELNQKPAIHYALKVRVELQVKLYTLCVHLKSRDILERTK